MGHKTEDITDNPASEPDLLSPPATAGLPQELAARESRAGDSAIMSELKKKLAQNLPPGHPSSPFNEDGSRRPTDTSVKDAERLIPPLTEAQWIDHRQEVTDRLEKALAEGLSTHKLFTINSVRDIWTDERADVHDQIIDEFYLAAIDVPCEGLAIIAGGLPGAGKTTVLEEQAGIDRANYLTINPDDFKEELARRGLIPEVEGLTPMEASALAHEESSYLARQLALRALAEGKNVIWDITMSSKNSTLRRLNELRGAGYQNIQGVFVDIPIETSVARAEARHRRGHDRHLAGHGEGGRMVSPQAIRSHADADHGSINRRTFEELKGDFDHWRLYDNSVEGRSAILKEEGPE